MATFNPLKPIVLANSPTTKLRVLTVDRASATGTQIIGLIPNATNSAIEDVGIWKVDGTPVGTTATYGPLANVVVRKWRWVLRNTANQEWITPKWETEEEVQRIALALSAEVVGRIKETYRED